MHKTIAVSMYFYTTLIWLTAVVGISNL